METHILDKRNLTRAQAFVLVCLLIASGSIAMAPGVFASNQAPAANAVTENIGDFTVTVTQSTMSQCYPGANVPVLQIDFTDNAGAGDVLNQFSVEYTGTNPDDVFEATLWVDNDGNGLFNPANDFSFGIVPIIGITFTWNPAWPMFSGVGSTVSFWVTIQTETDATVGNTVDALVPAGGIILQTNGTNVGIMDPADTPDFCTFVSNILPPQAVYGYLYQDDLVTTIPGVTVTLRNSGTGETIAMPTDLNGRYFFDLNVLLQGISDGETVEVRTSIPNQAWNSGAVTYALPLLQLDLIVDTTDPVSVLSIVPSYNNTGTWDLEYTLDDPLVNGYASGVQTFDFYVETPATPGVFNLWVTGTETYTPSAGEGYYYFYTLATDLAGNVESKSVADDSILYDITDPTSTVTGPATSDILVFDVTYNSADPGTVPSGVNHVSLWYSDDAGASWTYVGDDAATGTFVGVTVPADGTYEWYTAAFDNAGNSEVNPPTDATFIEFTTIVDTAAPLIGATTVAPLFITNNPLNPYDGTLPPAMVTTTVTDDNLGAAGWGIRNEFDWEGTIYFTCDITNEVMPATYGWDGSYYHIGGILVTAGISPFNAPLGDLFVFGEVNGASAPESEIGNTLPSHYATFQPDGTFQAVYETLGTIDYLDDNAVGIAGDEFRAYRYDEGAGYVATASVSVMPAIGAWVILDIDPVPDGRYTVGVSAIDLAGNTAWINETTTPNMVITVDNFAPDADATGPATSDVFAFDVAYTWTADPAPSSGFVNITLWYNRNSAGWMVYGNDIAVPDGTFPVDVTFIGGDGTYDWYMTAYDATNNHELPMLAIEATTLVDTVAPTIGATIVTPLYINNDPLNTFNGITPPAMVTTTVTDDNLGAAGWGIRNEFDWEGTIYFTCDITNEVMPATYGWDGSYYHIGGVLVTAGISPANAPLGDLFVFGEVNGASLPEDEIGNTLPSHYATFQPDGTFQAVYETLGTIDYLDDNAVGIAGDEFRAYRYDEGAGYVATASVSVMPAIGAWVILDIDPVPDGRYTVGVSAIDLVGNTAWINETTTPNMVITVDNFAPDADATGPAISGVYVFDVTYTYISDPVPSSGMLNVSLWMNYEGNGWIWFASEPTLDGAITVDVSAYGDGTYEWFIAAFDMTLNHEDLVFLAEATTLIDNTDPVIDVTMVDLFYIATVNTFDGTMPPVTVTVNDITEPNLAAAAWGIRDEFNWEGTLYFTYDITNDAMPSMQTWDGNQYFINGELVTVTMSDTFGIDMIVYGELDGANATGHEIGNFLPSHYAVFSGIDLSVTMYATHSSLDPLDHELLTLTGGETFQAYRYDEGTGYIVTAALSTYTLGDDFWIPLDPQPMPDGRYAVCVSAADWAQNSAWTNETNGNPVITVDNTQPALNVEMSLSGDNNGNGLIDNNDWFLIWVNVTDMNEDATTMPIVDADEYLLPDQPMDGWTYLGLGVWEFTYIVKGPEFTASNIDVSFRDLAGNLIDMPNALVYDIYGSFDINYASGWNLFCIPVLDPTVGGTPLASADDIANAGAQMVSKWDFATQRYVNYIPGFHLPGDPQNFAIVPDEAYWAWMPAAGTISVQGLNPGGRNVNLGGPGWNMVGYMDPVNTGDVETDWAPLVSCGAYDDIAYYDGTTFQHYIFPGTLMNLVPGRGYFVWSDGPATITYNAVAWNTNTGMGYPTIQAAIDSANPYDQIDVGPGIYNEQLVITQPLTLQGAGSGIFAAGSQNTVYSTAPAESSVIDADIGGNTLMGGAEWSGSAIAILSDDVTISGFEVSNSVTGGVYLYGVEGCYISDVKATNNEHGFYLSLSDWNTIENCEASYNTYKGIMMDWAYYNDIQYNTVSGNEHGMSLWSLNNVFGNTIDNNVWAILIEDDSNTITENYITGNNYGVRSFGSGNIIAKNSFIGNTDPGNENGANIWNLPLPDGGNYWDVWTSPDANGDGIVDTPFVTEGIVDNYPWTTENGWENPSLAVAADETTLTGDLDLMTATFPSTVPAFFDTAGYYINSEIVLAGDVNGDITITRDGVPMTIVGGLTAGTYTYTELVVLAYGIPEPPASPFNNAIYGGTVETYTISVTNNPAAIDTTVTIRSIISNDNFATRTVLAELMDLPLILPQWSLAPVNLGTSGDFVILAETGITTTGTTSITGDIGVSPITSTAITGFGLIMDASGEFSTSSLVTGNVYAANYAVPTPTKMTTAVSDMETAYTDAAGRTLPDYTNLYSGDLTGQTLGPGLYKWTTGVLISAGGVTISGAASDVWIFQIDQNLLLSSGAIVTLGGEAQVSNIFWQVAGQTTLESTVQMKGIILCKTQIVMQSGATLEGRALAQTAVTLISNGVIAKIVVPPSPVINTDTGEGFNTIQAAIDDTDTLNGHTITVANGTYYEQVTINKAVTLLGENPLSTTISNSGGTVVRITVNGVAINGFEIVSSYSGLYYGIQMNSVQNCLITNNIIHYCYSGIYMMSASNNEISGNALYSHYQMGIHMSTSSNFNNIHNNTIYSNARAVYMTISSCDNKIANNTMTTNTYTIYSEQTSNRNIIIFNSISGGQRGIYLSASMDNLIVGNTVTGCTSYGIHLYFSTTGSGPVSKIYNNNFIGNAVNAYSQSSSTHVWSVAPPIGGNYWSDYAGVDSNSDGYGDTAYLINTVGADYYPLMAPWS